MLQILLSPHSPPSRQIGLETSSQGFLYYLVIAVSLYPTYKRSLKIMRLIISYK